MLLTGSHPIPLAGPRKARKRAEIGRGGTALQLGQWRL
jgi:hypothetical protein